MSYRSFTNIYIDNPPLIYYSEIIYVKSVNIVRKLCINIPGLDYFASPLFSLLFSIYIRIHDVLSLLKSNSSTFIDHNEAVIFFYTQNLIPDFNFNSFSIGLCIFLSVKLLKKHYKLFHIYYVYVHSNQSFTKNNQHTLRF